MSGNSEYNLADEDDVNTREPDPSPKPPIPWMLPLSTRLWVILAVISTGFVVGWLVGLSESPVTGVVLPLLFTLVAGAGGFHFATSKATADVARQVAHYAAQATVGFMLACGIGLHFAITIRTSSTSRTVDASQRILTSPEELARLSPVEIIRLSALEKKLLLLGLDTDAVQVFSAKYINDYSSDAAARRADGSPTEPQFDELEVALNSVSKELENASAEARESSVVARLRSDLPMFIGHVKNLRKLVEASGKHVPKDHYKEFLSNIKSDLKAVLEHVEGYSAGTVASVPPDLNYVPLYGLALVIAAQEEPLRSGWDYNSKSLGREDMELLDKAIQLGMETPTPRDEDSKTPRYATAP